MTSDDVVAARPVGAAAETPADQTKQGDQAKNADGDGKPNADETAWREAVKKAHERANSSQRAAEETELRVTELRNQLSASGQEPGDRNQTMTELAAVGERLKQQRAEAREAANALNKLLEEGRQKNYKEEAGPAPVSKGGEANEDYYRSKFAELTKAAEDADRSVQLYQNRISELNQRIGGNSRTGDNFYIGQLQQERDEAQRSLDEAREKYQKAQADITALKEEARAAGVPPGVFR
jgi:DNA repair exonuclease SbcCD ATPase subunit